MTFSETSPTGGPSMFSCLQKAKESKWTDAALITGCIVLLGIGILASTGVFNFIGTTNAAYLSYGMYGSSVLILIAEILKVAIINCSKGTNDTVTKPIVNNHSTIPVVKSINSPAQEIQNLEEVNKFEDSFRITNIQSFNATETIKRLQQEQKLLIKSQIFEFNHTLTDPLEFLKSGWQSFIGEFKDKTSIRRMQKAKNSDKILVKYYYSSGVSTSKINAFDPNKKYAYTVPNSVSLMPKYGKMLLYGSRGFEENPWMQAGILLDLEKCKLKQEHIYKQDASTGRYGQRNWESYCYGVEMAEWQIENNNKTIEEMNALYRSRGACSLDELRMDTSEDKIYPYNELLVGAHEDAIVGLFAAISEEDANQKNQATNYANKIFCLVQQKCFNDELGIVAPVYLYQSDQGLQIYSDEQIQKDFCSLRENKELRNSVLSILGCSDRVDAFHSLEKMLDIEAL